MCGRYQFSSGQPGAQALLAWLAGECGVTAQPTGDICPGTRVPVLLGQAGQVRARAAVWGFPTGGGKLVINARAETAAQRPMFSQCLQTGRCAVPTTGFYEWAGDRRQYRFTLPGHAVLYLAGLMDEFEGEARFCILTTGANASVEKVHPRMPLVLQKSQLRAWLLDGAAAQSLLLGPTPPLNSAPTDGQLSLW